MTAVHLLLLLLSLAYVGSILMRGRAIRGYGLPSGTEYVLLGIVLGPHVLGVIELSTVRTFEPIVQVGLCWLALVVGADYGFVGDRRIAPLRLLLGIAVTMVAFLLAAGAAYAVARGLLAMAAKDAHLLAVGLGAVSCETTRHAVRWVVLRYAAHGPIADVLADIADADDALPLLVLAVLFALAPADTTVTIAPWAGAAITVGVGLGLGALVAALLRRELKPAATWGFLLGSTLLGIGALTRVGLAAMSTMFAMGFALVALSRHRAQLRRTFNRTEHAVLLPTLMLAGAHLSFRLPWQSALLVGVVVAARILGKLLTGASLRLWRPARSAGGVWLGLGLMPSGALTMTIGLACALRFPPAVGDAVLAAAAANVLLGELIGPASLLRALTLAGEIEAASTKAPDLGAPDTTDSAGDLVLAGPGPASPESALPPPRAGLSPSGSAEPTP